MTQRLNRRAMKKGLRVIREVPAESVGRRTLMRMSDPLAPCCILGHIFVALRPGESAGYDELAEVLALETATELEDQVYNAVISGTWVINDLGDNDEPWVFDEARRARLEAHWLDLMEKYTEEEGKNA